MFEAGPATGRLSPSSAIAGYAVPRPRTQPGTGLSAPPPTAARSPPHARRRHRRRSADRRLPSPRRTRSPAPRTARSARRRACRRATGPRRASPSSPGSPARGPDSSRYSQEPVAVRVGVVPQPVQRRADGRQQRRDVVRGHAPAPGPVQGRRATAGSRRGCRSTRPAAPVPRRGRPSSSRSSCGILPGCSAASRSTLLPCRLASARSVPAARPGSTGEQHAGRDQRVAAEQGQVPRRSGAQVPVVERLRVRQRQPGDVGQRPLQPAVHPRVVALDDRPRPNGPPGPPAARSGSRCRRPRT